LKRLLLIGAVEPKRDRRNGDIRIIRGRNTINGIELPFNWYYVPGLPHLLKSPYVLEFLDLPDTPSQHEKDLERAIISNLQAFLLELGKGFSQESGKRAGTGVWERLFGKDFRDKSPVLQNVSNCEHTVFAIELEPIHGVAERFVA